MYTLEVCIDRSESLQAALAGGARRVELCAALELGGVTPSHGMIACSVELAAAADRPFDVMVMVRPHPGGFVYSSSETRIMERDIAAARKLGAHGVVFGALTAERQVDCAIVRDLVAAARPLSTTFHRAFDLAADPRAALDALIECRVDRVLTSGQSAAALAGADLLARLVRQANGSLSIMAGAGVHSRNVVELVRRTGVTEVHASARAAATSVGTIQGRTFADTLDFVRPDRMTDEREVRALVAALADLERGATPYDSNSRFRCT